ncbi:uncharacterized protein BX663DRAFT_509117 [Cokeromyces recurvatus]|uniref:uncharacterized protein n=1 Tax=Cokeromyces recurvatus TaxID=90255 RepID=UPI00221ED8E8|nr:uncharacterized protein BX663DRAFT_509117 [Cokeromyces recurvatus]KAI7902988.1 hypothetical protein BX663DRAFT_509117 [Cokeromyces recurvatus]
MEKYSRWRDAGTGIQPFLPPVPPRIDSSFLITLSNIIHIIVGPVQGILKILLISLLSLVYILFVPLLGTLLTPIKPLKRGWTRLFSAILLRLVLFLSGFFYIKTETVSLRKSRDSKGRPIESPQVQNGSVIVANWTSYIDVLYLAFRFDPVFTQLYTETNKVRVISLWEAIRLTSKIPESKPSKNNELLYSVEELALKAKKNKWGPIVIFAEGTTTNGRALLRFAPVFKECEKVEKNMFQLMSFKYEYGNMPPTFTVGNQFYHFFKLCSQFYNTLLVKSLARDELLNEFLLHNQSEDPVGDVLISSLGNISKLRKTNLTMLDKRDFMIYYKSRTKK